MRQFVKVGLILIKCFFVLTKDFLNCTLNKEVYKAIQPDFDMNNILLKLLLVVPELLLVMMDER